ncbi:MAG: hypothetical protein ABIM30_06015 [candidate division WOR-3 bacterium]
MDIPFFVLAIVAVAGYQDFVKREVNNFLFILMWAFTLLYYPAFNFLVVFLISWFVAEVFEAIKRPVVGFGDVLVFPVFYAFIEHTIGFPLQITLLGTIAAQLSRLHSKKPVPYITIVFLIMLIAKIVQLVKPLVIFF